jgi:hypothetical protein
MAVAGERAIAAGGRKAYRFEMGNRSGHTMNDEVALAPPGTKGRPQVKRERADRLIAALLIEAQRINSDPLPWYDVTRLSVFGSYLTAKPVLGDLDIAVRTTPRWRPESGGFTRAWQNFPADCPPPKAITRDQLSLIHWPRLYVLKRLKRVGRGISLHSQQDLDSCGFDFQVVFEKPERDLLFVK